jgi:cobalt-zinc-cadmium efflux system membrane fusion protein
MRNTTLSTILAACIAATGCGGAEPKSAEAQTNPANTSGVYVADDASGIKTMTVQTGSIPQYLEIPGHIVPDPTQVVHVFPAAGGRVVEMKVRPGDRVQKGQMLAVLESSDVSRAMADYQKARTDADLKQKTLDRSKDLYAHHAIAEKELQQAEADFQSALQEQQATLDHLHLLGTDPGAFSDQLSVVAPRDGVVLDIGAAPGELNNSLAASQPLCTLADLATVWVEGELFEKDIMGLKAGTPAEVTLNAYPGEKWEGQIAVISDAVDPVTRTLKVRVVLQNPGLRLKPDMFASIRLLRSSSQGILVPGTAVDREGSTAYVFVSKGGNNFERREVVLGRMIDDNIEVTKGLTPGNLIVSEGVVLLRAASQD